MTGDDIDRIDKQFDSLEETLRCGFARMESQIDQFSASLSDHFGETDKRMIEMERRADERHEELMSILRGLQR